MSRPHLAALPTTGLSPVSLRAQAATVLEDQLINGRYAPGERLSEAAIAEELTISRGPVRESLQQLGGAGLLRHAPNRGWYVPELTKDEIRDLYELREAVEGMAGRLAAQRRTADDIIRLRQILHNAQDAVDHDGHGYPQGAPETDLHAALLTIARNPVLEQRASEAQRQLALARYRSAASSERATRAMEEHAQIVDSIESGKAAVAQRLTMSHIRKSSELALSQHR